MGGGNRCAATKPNGYNQGVHFRILVVLSGALLLVGCQRGAQTPEAVRQGVIDHLSSRPGLTIDLNAMNIEVTSVSFRQNEADATVSFRPKGGSAGAGMEMRYTLERKGDRWAVKGKAEAAGAPHGSGMGGGMPSGHPPMGAAPGPKPGETGTKK